MKTVLVLLGVLMVICPLLLAGEFARKLNGAPTIPVSDHVEPHAPVVATSAKVPELSISKRDGKIVLSGVFSSQEEKEKVIAAAMAKYGAADFVDEIGVSPGASAGWISSVSKLLPDADSDMENQQIQISEGAILLTGEAPSADAKEAIASKLGGIEGLLVKNELTVRLPKLDAPAAVQKVLDKAILGKTVEFEFDSDVITEAGKLVLDPVAELLVASPDVEVEVQGHTDNKGMFARNMQLSQRRAQSVSNYLSEKGVGQSRLTPKGYGETRPIASNRTESGRERNRRISFKVKP